MFLYLIIALNLFLALHYVYAFMANAIINQFDFSDFFEYWWKHMIPALTLLYLSL